MKEICVAKILNDQGTFLFLYTINVVRLICGIKDARLRNKKGGKISEAHRMGERHTV